MNVKELDGRLAAEYDVADWWPAESPWEVMVGAILVQQTAWENVVKVLGSLKERGLMNVDAIDSLPVEDLQHLVRPAGFYCQKARNIKSLAAHVREHHRSDPMGLLTQETGTARRELLSLPGIGKETADVILLFAGDRPRFVAAAYVARILNRTGLCSSSDYDLIQRFMSSQIDPDPRRYRHFYALLVHHARSVCRPRPRCGECCLRTGCEFTKGTKTARSR